MKRFIALVLVLSLVLPSCPFAFAASSSLSQSEDSAIRQTADGYVMVVGEGTSAEEYPVGRIDISFSDPDSVAAALNHSGVAQEIKDHISARYTTALRSGNTEVEMTLYSQELLPRSRTLLPPVYNVYNGVQMRSDVLVETGIRTPTKRISSGSNMPEELGTIFDIIITTMGLVDSATIALFSGGISILTALIRAGHGSYITGSDNGYTETAITYNINTRWTYCMANGDWQLGLITQSGEVTDVYILVYTYDSQTHAGNTEEFDFAHPNDEIENGDYSFESEHYSSHWVYAYQNMNNPIEEYLQAKINGITFYF